MAKKRNHRGFTHLDALFACVACLVLVLMVPVLLAKPRERSIRTLCAANLGQIGKTMFLYAADNEDALPRAGRNTAWGPVADWMVPWRIAAFGLTAVDGSGGKASISSCFYLLVKYYQAPTKLFLCRGDKGTTEFKLSDVLAPSAVQFELSDAWDFGPGSGVRRSCSFSYHVPFGQYALTTSRDPNPARRRGPKPLAPQPCRGRKQYSGIQGGPSRKCGNTRNGPKGNVIAHGLDGQNVLFLDGRVTFETRSFCGLEYDNIYTVAIGASDRGLPTGTVPVFPYAMPASLKDSIRLHDPRLSTDDPSLRR